MIAVPAVAQEKKAEGDKMGCENNTCKGKSTCKGFGNESCAGKNTCKGHGSLKAADEAACTKAGGKWMAKK